MNALKIHTTNKQYTVTEHDGPSFEKQDIEMGFAATCLSTGKVFIHDLEGLSVPSVHNTEEVQMVGEILGPLGCYAM